MPAPQNPFESSTDSYTNSPKYANLPERMVVYHGWLQGPFVPHATPATRSTDEVVNNVTTTTRAIYLGDQAALVRPYVRTIHQLTVGRIGIGTTEGVGLSKPTNSPQLRPAGVSLLYGAQAFAQVSPLVDTAVLTGLPVLLSDADLREAMLADAILYVEDLQRGLAYTYTQIDKLIRPLLPILRPLQSIPGIGAALKPFYALTQDPADKAQETQRVRGDALKEGEARGLAKGLAQGRKEAAKAAVPGTQVNIAGGTGAKGADDEAPAPAPAPPGKTRRRSR